MSVLAYIAIITVLAVAMDLGVIFWTKRDLKKRGIDQSQSERLVYLWGVFSPTLTWMKNVFLPCFSRLHTDVMPLEDAKIPDKAGKTPIEEHLPRGATEAYGENTTWRLRWLEWGLIVLAVLLFCSGILDLRSDTRLPGNEAEVFQVLDWVLYNSLLYNGKFPLWNPYIFTGLPFVADPMLHIYNPVVTLPVLFLGVQAGFKVGIFLSFLIAAFGMRYLGSVLGFRRAARIWAALMYAFAGQPVARFFQGEYLFVLAFAWIPWIFASLIQVARTRRRVHIVQSGIFLALLFFCGNAYYQLYVLIFTGLFVLIMVTKRRKRFPFLSFRIDLLKTFSLVAVLALGLIAVQLLPLLEFWPHLSKDLNVEGSHTLAQIILDFISKDTFRPDAFNVLPAREEFYAYIGLTPFLGLLLLPLAFWKRDRKVVNYFVIMFIVTVVWIGMLNLPGHDFFLQTRMLSQFRHLLRMLIFGSFALIVLAGLGIDTLWRICQAQIHQITEKQDSPNIWSHLRTYSAYIGIFTLGVLMLVGVGDLFSTHRGYVLSQESYLPGFQVMGWLRQHDPGTYYVRHNPTNTWYGAVVSNQHRNIEVWYPFGDIRTTETAINQRSVNASPRYLVQSERESPPEIPGASMVSQFMEYHIYSFANSLPIAFVVDNEDLWSPEKQLALQSRDVTPVVPFFKGPNEAEIIFEGGIEDADIVAGNTLVLLFSHYPGWNLRIDGHQAELRNISGYLAAEVQPGVHKYTFTFRPRSFYAGLVISLLAFTASLYWIFREVRFSWQAVRQRFVKIYRDLLAWPSRRIPQPGINAPATYRDGTLIFNQPLELSNEAQVHVTVETEWTDSMRPAARRWVWASKELFRISARSITLATGLFVLSLTVYLLVRLIGLSQFPIYFFTDEAIQTLSAADFVKNGFKAAGEFLPTYFRNVDHFNLSTSVYLQVLPYLVFGKSLVVTRAVSVLATLLAAVSISLILRDALKLPYWWIGTLLFSIAPAWFLHSRTAFETALMVSLYAGGLYFYLIYRLRSTKYLYTSLVLFALAFYSYSPAQVIVSVTGLLLLLSDWRYHWQNRSTALRGLGLLIVLALPYVRFRLNHAGAVEEHLVNLNSYWLQSLPIREKVTRFIGEYLYGFNPAYWFFSNDHDLVRHLMKGYGHLHWTTLPFILAGLAVSLIRFRSPAYRAVLIALLAAPSGAAMAQISVTRALVMVVPATLLSAIGLIAFLTMLERKLFNRRIISLSAFLLLLIANIWMLSDSLSNGPTWYSDYGLGGMQFGGAQLFGAIEDYMEENPQASLILSPTWANGPDILARYFLGEPLPIQLGNVDEHMHQYKTLDEDMVFVMTPDEFERASTSGKFSEMRVDEILPYPNGQPGFYFVHLSYVANIKEILESDRAARRQLQETSFILDGEVVEVHHSLLDMGKIEEILDGNPRSLARTFEANPFIFELTFTNPRPISGLSLIIGDTRVGVLVRLFKGEGTEPVEYFYELSGSFQDPQVHIDFAQIHRVETIYLEITDLSQAEPGHVHVWEIEFH